MKKYRIKPKRYTNVSFCYINQRHISFFKLIFIGVQLLNKVVLISAVLQSKSLHISPLYWIFFSFKLHRALSRRRQWHPTPVLLPEKSHGWRSLVGCHLWDRTEQDTTEATQQQQQQSFEQSFVCYTAGSHQLSILYIVYICQSQFPSSSHSLFPSLYPFSISARE